MKIIFLDVDGVLNHSHCPVTYENHFFVMNEKISLLKTLINETDAKLVLTSTWRKGWIDLENGNNQSEDARIFLAFQERLKEYGLKLLDKTPFLENGTRGAEVDAWLKMWNGEVIESFVIFDDMNEKKLRPHANRLVRTSFTQGLLRKHIEKAKKILIDLL